MQLMSSLEFINYLLFRFGARLQVLGAKLLGVTLDDIDVSPEVDSAESFIVVMNHQSCLDLVGNKNSKKL